MKINKFENQRSQFATLNSINFSKRKFDYFSYAGIMAIIGTAYYLLFDCDKFLTNMDDSINFTLWVFMISYPLIRYFFPFHVYTLDSTGITLKKGKYLKWNHIKSVDIYDNYEEVKDDDTPIYKLKITVLTLDGTKKEINLSNYTIDDTEFKAKIKPLFNKNFKMKDALVKIFETFYQRHKTNFNKNHE